MAEDEGEWVERPDGTFELVNPKTGEILAVEKRNPVALERIRRGGKKQGKLGHFPPQSETHRWITTKGGHVVWAPKHEVFHDPNVKYPFCEATWGRICELISQGYKLEQIYRMDGIPPYWAVNKWRAKRPHLDHELKLARKRKAEYAADKALEVAENAKESNAMSSRLKFDAYKWTAERCDPDTYGKQTKIVGDPERPIAILVDTGIRRDPGAAPHTSSASAQAAPNSLPEPVNAVPTQDPESKEPAP